MLHTRAYARAQARGSTRPGWKKEVLQCYQKTSTGGLEGEEGTTYNWEELLRGPPLEPAVAEHTQTILWRNLHSARRPPQESHSRHHGKWNEPQGLWLVQHKLADRASLAWQGIAIIVPEPASQPISLRTNEPRNSVSECRSVNLFEWRQRLPRCLHVPLAFATMTMRRMWKRETRTYIPSHDQNSNTAAGSNPLVHATLAIFYFAATSLYGSAWGRSLVRAMLAATSASGSERAIVR